MSSVNITELLDRPCFQAKKSVILVVVVIFKSKSIVAPTSASLSNFFGILLIKKYSQRCLAVYNKKDFYFLLMMV